MLHGQVFVMKLTGSLMTYYGDDVLSWQAAVSYCERLPGSVGILDLPDWIDHTVWNPLWTAKTRGQHSNFPQGKANQRGY